jgi:hypothetical protein
MEFDLEADAAGMVAPFVFPIIEVQKQAGVFGKITLESLLQNPETRRAPGSNYNRSNFEFDDASYSCVEHGMEEVVDDREAMMYAEYFDAELISTMRAYSAVLRDAEKRVADAVFNTTTWTGGSLTTAITHEWDDAVNCVPITDVEAAVQSVYDGSGLWANALIINRKVFRNLRNSEQIIERINSAGAGNPSKASDVTAAMLAQVFDLEHIIVGGTSRNTANEGQTASVGQIWSDEYAMVCKIATGPDFREPCIGRTFHWSEDGSTPGGTIETYRDENVRGSVVRVRHDVDEVVLYPQAGHLLSNITT